MLPQETLENTCLYNRAFTPRDAGQVAFKREGFQVGGVIHQGELIREHLLAHPLFIQEGIAAFHQAAVEPDPIHKADQFRGRGRPKDDIVAVQGKLLGFVDLILPHQEGQVLLQAGRIEFSHLLSGLFGNHFPFLNLVGQDNRHLGIGGLEILLVL